ncbi:MAG TPA: dTMP kinase [Bacillota bacterium]
MKGIFVTFEGVDGTGKSTQARLFAERLQAAGYDPVLSREPGGTVVAEKIRELLLTDYGEKVSPRTEALLYSAARAQHISTVIRPALAEGKIVICERFSDSTVAYQGYGSGLDLAVLRAADGIATDGLKPDLTFLFTLSLEECWARVTKRNARTGNDRMEAKGRAFLERVYEGYLRLAAEEPYRIKLIECGGKSIGEIQEIVWEHFARAYLIS